MLQAPFYELDGQIAIDLPGARGVFTTATWGDVRETQDEISQRLGVGVIRAHQVHGNTPLVVGVAPPNGTLAFEVDAVVTALTEVAPMVITADCLPVLVAGGGAVAAIHAGWRGLRAGVIEAAVARVQKLAPGAELSAAIGPAAGSCCYEVGDELHELFAQRGVGFRSGQNLDLKAIARFQLAALGVNDVHDCGLCTICAADPPLFSYRRDGDATGRQGAIVWLT